MQEKQKGSLGEMDVLKSQQQSLILEEDEKKVERLENFYNEQHDQEEEIYL